MRENGGTGRRARLRGVWGDSYGFDSRFSHQNLKKFLRLKDFLFAF